MRCHRFARAATLAAALLAGPALAQAPAPPWQLDWAEGTVFYEVFVRSFADSDGDGIGDFRGLTSKLDYLNDGKPGTSSDLGVGGVWLMPVFRSPSYHGYDVTDYEHVNPEYGTEEDFDRLLAEAHRRGIKVIVDLVMNHTSSTHPWFVEAAADTASAHRDWYVWSDRDLGWGQPWNPVGPTWHPSTHGWYYGVFWSGMPDLNFRNPAVRAEMLRIADLWLARGVDGFRLDATRHLIETGPGAGESDADETHAFLRQLSAHIRRVRPDALLVGENWTDTATIAPYFGSADSVARGDGLPCNFDFPLAGAIVKSVQSGRRDDVVQVLEEVARSYPKGALDGTFLTNHDMARVATQLGREPGSLGAAAALLLTLPGTPFLYYGEEIGLQNGSCSSDECKRTPMAWDGTANGGFTRGTPWWPPAPGNANVAAQTGDSASLLSRYRQLIRARGASAALRRGEVTAIASAASGVLAFVRTGGGESVLVAHNLGGGFAGTSVAAKGSISEPLFADPGATASGGAGTWSVFLPPRGSGVWRIR